jgi:hypothetical protein
MIESLLVIAGTVLGCVLLMDLVTVVRSPVRSTRRRRLPLLATTTPLRNSEVRLRLAVLAQEAGLTVRNATDPERAVLVSKGLPFGRTGPGYFFPVYLGSEADGRTRVEVGIRRRFPAARRVLEAPLAARFADIEGALGVDSSAPTGPAPAPDATRTGPKVLRLVGVVLGIVVAVLVVNRHSDRVHWETGPGAIGGKTLVVQLGDQMFLARHSLPTWYDRSGERHTDSWPTCLRPGARTVKFGWVDDGESSGPDQPRTIVAVDCR